MRDTCWIAVDTETSGINSPIYAVEIAAQRMLGWEPEGEAFRVLLNHDVPIESTAEALHGYSRAYLKKHGMDPVRAYALFAEYAGDCPLVAYNLGFDWKRVLAPEYRRLGIQGGGREGFCALTLARRVIEGTENYRLETMKNHFQLGSGRSHKAMNDVETMVKLMGQVMAPRLEKAGLLEWEDVARFSRRGPIAWCRQVISGEQERGNTFRPRRTPSLIGRTSESKTRQKHRNTFRRGSTPLNAPLPLIEAITASSEIESPVSTDAFFLGRTLEQKHETESKAFYVMHYDPWINELFELCKRILAVEVIGDTEIRVLSEWLENCPCTHLYPVNAVARLLEKGDAKVLRKELENILPA